MDTADERLAEEVRRYPHLYNSSLREYKDTFRCANSWREIAQALGMDERACRQRWKNLRDKYVKARKRAKGRSGGDAADCVGRSPALLQLGWLSGYVRHRETDCNMSSQGAGSGDDLQKQRHEEETHSPIPVVSTSFSVQDPCPSSHPEMGVSQKRKRQSTADSETSSADVLSSIRDEDELFLLSLLPSLKRLNTKKKMAVRIKFQQVLYAAEFED